MVDSRVRVQLGPSPMNHEKNTNRLNKWSDLFKLKEGTCRTAHIQSYPAMVSPVINRN